MKAASVLQHAHEGPLPVLSVQGAIPLLTALIQDGPHGPHAEGATWALHSLTTDHAINKQLAAEVSLPPDRRCQQFWHDETQAGCWGWYALLLCPPTCNCCACELSLCLLDAD